jgi:predicted ATPase
MPATLPQHLYLVNASGIRPFGDVYRALTGMRFYHIDPTRMQHTASAGEDELLAEDGSNTAGVLLRLGRQQPAVLARVIEYVQAMVPEILDVAAIEFGGQFSLTFRQAGETDGLPFGVSQMSDGTLRALGILLTLFQRAPEDIRFLTLIAMEEPETGLHRAALAAMRDAFAEASHTVQILVTTHSTDLLDTKDFDPDWLRVVINEGGVTRIGPLSEATQSIVRDHLSTAGELLRSSPLRPLVESGTSATLFNE